MPGSLCPCPAPAGSPKAGLGARLDTGQCHTSPGKGALGRKETPFLQAVLRRIPGMAGAPGGTGAQALLTFVEDSHAGASLGLAQHQHFCDHLCQAAGQLGAEGQR